MATKPTVAEVVIEWLDARDWGFDTLPLASIPTRVALRLRHSKGWLVYVGPDSHGVEVHILAATFDPPEAEDDAPEYGDFTVIPSGWVQQVKYRTRKPRKPRQEAASDGTSKQVEG